MVTGIHSGDSQLVIVRADLKKKNTAIAQVDAFDGAGILINYEIFINNVSTELANQIEIILKDGVTVGKPQ